MKKPQNKKIQLSVVIDPEVVNALREKAFSERRSISNFVNFILADEVLQPVAQQKVKDVTALPGAAKNKGGVSNGTLHFSK